MSYCPLMSYAKQYAQEITCLGAECEFAGDKHGNCLIKQALKCYINAAQEKAEFTRTYVGKPCLPTEEVKLAPPRVDGSYIYF